MGVKTIQRSPKQATSFNMQVRMRKCVSASANVLPVGQFVRCSVTDTARLSQREQCLCQCCEVFDKQAQQAEQCMDKRWLMFDRAHRSKDGIKRRDKEEKGQQIIRPCLSPPLRLRELQLTFGRRDESGGTNVWPCCSFSRHWHRAMPQRGRGDKSDIRGMAMLPHDLYRRQLSERHTVHASCVWLYVTCVRLHVKAEREHTVW